MSGGEAGATALRWCDDTPVTLGWIDPRPAWMRRASHAVLSGGGVWILDPVDAEGIDERIRALGEPVGVVRLLDRHGRDCEQVARRLGVELYTEPFEGVRGAPFEVVPVARIPRWHEVALWFPGEAVLACGDALCNAPGYSVPGEQVSVHPLMRLLPPRALERYPVRHLLLGHGPGVHGDDARDAVRDALEQARRGLPRWAFSRARSLLGPFGRHSGGDRDVRT